MFFRKKYDGVIEAVRYTPQGWLSEARVFKRVGAAFSDRIILNREQLIEQINEGKRYMVGKRKAYMAGSFEVSSQVRLLERPDRDTLYTHQPYTDRDDLQGAPLF